MWSPAILLIVGAAFASPQYGWKNGKQYTYKIRSRTLAAFNPQSKQFTGILMKAHLIVQSNGHETLRAKIINPLYAQIHTRLENGWDSEIPQNQMNLQSFPLSGKTFEIKIKNGVVQDFIVDRDVPTWEVNILKSIVSQLQVDTQGENAEKSKHNQFPEGKQPYAMFKAMEDSVGGKCEVLYDISPLPQHMLQNNPELAPMPELREDGDVISLVKTKNYSNCDQRVSYHFGINGRNKWEPGSNDNGRYLSRASLSRVVITGNLKQYTIQSSVTTNKVVLSPDQEQNQQGMVSSKMNLTLHKMEDIGEPVSAPSNPQSTGNLVYNYNNPFESVSLRRPNKLNRKDQRHKNNENSDEFNSSSDSSDSIHNNDGDNYLQPKPKLTEAPYNPMLPYFIGNRGNSVHKSSQIEAVRTVKSIAQQIGNEMQTPNDMLEVQTLEKFTILTRLIRTMNVEQIADAQRDLYTPPRSSNELSQGRQDQNVHRYTWVALRDAAAHAGTGPALVNIKQWIQNKQIQGYEAAQVIDIVAKSARTPTPEYMDAYFEMVTMQETKKQSFVRDTAILSFAELIRHAIVNKQSAHNRYPVHSFGRLFSKNNKNVHEKYIPYIGEELRLAIENGDSKKIQVYTTALGKTAHPRMLSVFEPYIEGRKQVSPYQRFVMVLSMGKLASIHPKVARSVLYKIYSNNADHHEIRTAAVYLLMKTNPPASMLQRMADYTNYDSNKHVNSAVKSTIESLAQLQENEFRDISNAARTALPLLTPETYGPQYSRAIFKNYKNPQTHSGVSLVASYVGSDDSIIPKGVSITITPTYKGLKVPKVQIGGSISSVQNLWNFMEQKLNINQKNVKSDQKSQQQKYSPENIAKLLGIHGEEPEQVEGMVFMNNMNANYFLSFDNHSLEQIPEQLKELNEAMKKGTDFEQTRISNYEVTMSFPLETGYPLTFTLEAPTLIGVNGQFKSKTKLDSENQSPIPESATVSGKLRVIYGMKIQKRLGFVVPFEHQEYIAGVDKNVQFYLPLRSEVEYDQNQQEARIKLQPDDKEEEFKVIQFKTQPFTSKHDILSLQPFSNDKNTHIIRKDNGRSSQLQLNDDNNRQRLEFKWERQSSQLSENDENLDNKRQNALEAAAKLLSSIATLYYPNGPETVEFEKYSVKAFVNSDMSAEMRISHDSLTSESNNNAEDSEYWSPSAKVPHLEKSLNERERKRKMLSEVSKSINSVKANAVDLSFQINAGIQASLAVTAAFARSNVDQKSRVLLFASANTKEGQNYHLSTGFEGKTPNLPSFDYEETLKANMRREYDAVVHYGQGNGEYEQNHNKIKIQAKVKQTENLKNEIIRSSDAQACIKQRNQTGNKMNSVCQKVNHRASSVDEGDVIITFDNESTLKQMAMSALDYAEGMSYQLAETRKNREDKSENDNIKIAFKLSPHNEKVDVTIKSPEGKVEFNDITIGRYSNNNNENNEDSKDRQNPELSMSQNNACFLDNTLIKTFDNHRYSLQLGKCWYVAMTSYPKNDPDRPSQQKEIPENMHVSILTRENENGKKELKITIGEKEVQLTSGVGSHRVQAKVDGETVEYTKSRSYQGKQEGQVVFELFELPDQSVKLVSDKYNFEVEYDGSRAQIETGERYRDSVRGLCGNADGEPGNDQQTPQGCLLQKPEEFSATYALVDDNQCEGPARQNANKAKDATCSYESNRPGNVISDQEAGRESRREDGHYSDNDRCTRHRTMVTRTNSEICFSLRPVPSCSSSCNPNGMKTKNIQFHCVARNTMSEKVAQRVEQGANPDLSQKSISKTESHQVPITCSS